MPLKEGLLSAAASWSSRLRLYLLALLLAVLLALLECALIAAIVCTPSFSKAALRSSSDSVRPSELFLILFASAATVEILAFFLAVLGRFEPEVRGFVILAGRTLASASVSPARFPLSGIEVSLVFNNKNDLRLVSHVPPSSDESDESSSSKSRSLSSVVQSGGKSSSSVTLLPFSNKNSSETPSADF